MFFVSRVAPIKFVQDNKFAYMVKFVNTAIHANFALVSSVKLKHYLSTGADHLVH